jgi:phage gp36-like protein
MSGVIAQSNHTTTIVSPQSQRIVYLSTVELSGSYASYTDMLDFSVPDGVAFDVMQRSADRHLRAASRYVDSIVGQRWAVPLATWTDALVWAVCEIAFVRLVLGKRGFSPDGQQEKLYLSRLEAAEKWIREARNYEITIDPLLSVGDTIQTPMFYSDPPRRWNGRPGSVR